MTDQKLGGLGNDDIEGVLTLLEIAPALIETFGPKVHNVVDSFVTATEPTRDLLTAVARDTFLESCIEVKLGLSAATCPSGRALFTPQEAQELTKVYASRNHNFSEVLQKAVDSQKK